MNFLAHLYLSPPNTDVMMGNFFADAVKGKQFEQYNVDIQKGIRLHRAIDSYTDQHEIVKQSKRRLNDQYGHFKGVIIDIFYDHFLAKNWKNYSETPLDVFVNTTYQILQDNIDALPERTQYMIPYMVQYNWLYNYQFIEGIEDVLNGMNRRTGSISKMNLAISDLKEHYTSLEKDFTLFFEDLRIFSNQTYNQL